MLLRATAPLSSLRLGKSADEHCHLLKTSTRLFPVNLAYSEQTTSRPSGNFKLNHDQYPSAFKMSSKGDAPPSQTCDVTTLGLQLKIENIIILFIGSPLASSPPEKAALGPL